MSEKLDRCVEELNLRMAAFEEAMDRFDRNFSQLIEILNQEPGLTFDYEKSFPVMDSGDAVDQDSTAEQKGPST